MANGDSDGDYDGDGEGHDFDDNNKNNDLVLSQHRDGVIQLDCPDKVM